MEKLFDPKLKLRKIIKISVNGHTPQHNCLRITNDGFLYTYANLQSSNGWSMYTVNTSLIEPEDNPTVKTLTTSAWISEWIWSIEPVQIHLDKKSAFFHSTYNRNGFYYRNHFTNYLDIKYDSNKHKWIEFICNRDVASSVYNKNYQDSLYHLDNTFINSDRSSSLLIVTNPHEFDSNDLFGTAGIFEVAGLNGRGFVVSNSKVLVIVDVAGKRMRVYKPFSRLKDDGDRRYVDYSFGNIYSNDAYCGMGHPIHAMTKNNWVVFGLRNGDAYTSNPAIIRFKLKDADYIFKNNLSGSDIFASKPEKVYLKECMPLSQRTNNLYTPWYHYDGFTDLNDTDTGYFFLSQYNKDGGNNKRGFIGKMNLTSGDISLKYLVPTEGLTGTSAEGYSGSISPNGKILVLTRTQVRDGLLYIYDILDENPHETLNGGGGAANGK